ncbi:hypothetical protein BH23PLA1_BH23PLA1_11660 [soil metagenome]
MTRYLIAIFNVFGIMAVPAQADEPLPEGPGLSAKSPGDVGLGADPAVLFVEDFEQGTIEEIARRWDSASGDPGEVLTLSDDAPLLKDSPNRRSLKITATPGENTGGHLYTRLPEGVDTAFVRFYVKFPDPANYIHHFVHVGGYNPVTPYPQGGAGSKPEGHERVTMGIEPTGRNGREPAPGVWNFYAYWHEMKPSADGRHWGNGLHPIQPQRVPVEEWQCVELMLKLNTPGEPDGALALWIDGKLVGDFRQGVPRKDWTGLGFDLTEAGGEPFEGFDFRKSET